MLGILSNTFQVATRTDRMTQSDMPRSSEEVLPPRKRNASRPEVASDTQEAPLLKPGLFEVLAGWFKAALGRRGNFKASRC